MKTSAAALGLLVITSFVVQHCPAAPFGGGTGNALNCNGESVMSTWGDGPQGTGEYETITTYNGDCSATVSYTFNGSEYQSSQTWPVYGNCGCPPYTNNSVANGLWDHADPTLANINLQTFTIAVPTNIDHVTIYDLTSGNAVLNSGTLVTNFSLTVSNSIFTPGTPYAVSSSTSDNLIQGSACFQAGAPIHLMKQFETWQNDFTNIPGATLVAIDSTNHYSSLVQYAGGLIYVGSGTITNSPAVGIARTGNQLVLYWPATATNYFLQSTTNLTIGNWVTVTNGEPVVGVTVSNAVPPSFYRLKQLP
jgi:hypothetical protein